MERLRVLHHLGPPDRLAAGGRESATGRLSTWYLRLSRRRFSRGTGADRAAAFATLHGALVAVARVSAPILPFLAEELYGNLVAGVESRAPHSVHLTRFPSAELAPLRDERLEAAMAVARRTVDLARTLRGSAGLKVRQPLARLCVALPGGDLDELEALVALIAEEVNVRDVEVIGDDSTLVERRVKVLLPKVGKRLGPQIPAVMAAARDGAVEIRPDGSVELAGVSLAADEVEILATPRPGTVVAHDEGLLVVIDTELTADLRAEGDARELQRAIQDLRKEAGLALDDRIELHVTGLAPAVAARLTAVAEATLADLVDAVPDGAPTATVELAPGPATISLRRHPASEGSGT
ncbi:MAG: class I tRNA ligase family protein [Chloroflexi bacterium]|nr:class I tRNA ligase family protein [Chloroflexota bacterium]